MSIIVTAIAVYALLIVVVGFITLALCFVVMDAIEWTSEKIAEAIIDYLGYIH